MSPAVLLRETLVACRRVGRPFDGHEGCWVFARSRAAQSAATPEAVAEWEAAFDATRGCWRRAYLQLPVTGFDAAGAVLGEGRGPRVEDDLARCEWCDELLPVLRLAHKRFCDERCRRAAGYLRERGRAWAA